jgi:beta-xylosidase/lysophospholipase L1-like esterase
MFHRLLLALLPALAFAAEPTVPRVHIVLVGDSTVTDQSGWGLGFRQFVGDGVLVSNAAQGGRSSKSYRDEGHWEKALALKGDYYLIQFGHNDQPGKGPKRETDPATTYYENMARYVDEVRAQGGQPILVTSLTRRIFSKTDPARIASSLTPWAGAVQKLAAAKNVPLIDLHASSIAYCEAIGPERTAAFNFLDHAGKKDITHLAKEGSVAFARLVVDELRQVVPALAPVLRAEPLAPSAWSPDLGDGTYRNPILHADYSDPDVVRVGDDYWMTASSFSHVPGLPILHSRDLVNWTLVTHALPRLVPEEAFRTPQHGKGVWAPAIRHHAGKFWIYYPDPDFGIYLVTATEARGPWSTPVLVKGGRGLIDPCPLWDDDGRVYLVHGWANSRANVKNVLTLLELNAEGTKVIDDFGYLINGDKLPNYTTLEGPKLYKRNGWYYVFAPAGGVATGWQSVFRSKSIRGPYEDRIVLAQGESPVNGPHQGALVDTPSGENWFIHFQDKEAYGRIVHLQPVRWENDWPLMGTGVATGAAKGEPVLVHEKPALPLQSVAVPATSDDFNAPTLGLQWQWQANPGQDWFSLTAKPGALRLFAQPEPKPGNLYDAPFLLMQKFPALEFTATATLAQSTAAQSGLIVFGYDYAWIGLRAGKLVQVTVLKAAENPVTTETVAAEKIAGPVHLRVTVADGGKCRFSFSTDGKAYTPLGEPFTATVGRWVGAKVGLFAAGASGYVDFDHIHVAAR